MTKIATTLFTCLFLGLTAPACTFDPGGTPIDPAPDADVEPGPDAIDDGDADMTCSVDSDCDDGSGCTIDVCASDGTCRHYDDADAACECVTDADCDDGNASTTDACDSGRCVNESSAPVCGDGSCDGGEDHASCPSDCSAPTSHVIHCDNVNGTTVTISGNLRTALVTDAGTLPGNPSYVTFGANSGGNGWPSSLTDPDPSLPKCTVNASGDVWTCSGSIAFGDSVQGWNFYVASDSGHLRWFRLADYEVTGHCAKGNSGGLLYSCETLPCTAPVP